MARSERSAGVVVFRNPSAGRQYLLLNSGRFWDFPKGHVETGETDRAAALRELHEEAGIADAKLLDGFAHQIRYFFRDGKTLVHKSVVFFLAQVESPRIRISNEHVGFEFLSYPDARARLNYPNSREILRLAEEFLSDAANL